MIYICMINLPIFNTINSTIITHVYWLILDTVQDNKTSKNIIILLHKPNNPPTHLKIQPPLKHTISLTCNLLIINPKSPYLYNYSFLQLFRIINFNNNNIYIILIYGMMGYVLDWLVFRRSLLFLGLKLRIWPRMEILPQFLWILGAVVRL